MIYLGREIFKNISRREIKNKGGGNENCQLEFSVTYKVDFRINDDSKLLLL